MHIFLLLWLVFHKEIIPHNHKNADKPVSFSRYGNVGVAFPAFVLVVWHQKAGGWNCQVTTLLPRLLQSTFCSIACLWVPLMFTSIWWREGDRSGFVKAMLS